MKGGFLFLAILLGINAQLDPASKLKVNWIESPAFIDLPNFSFSWDLTSSTRNQLQNYVQVWVSKNPSASSGDVWDSGKVATSTKLLDYAGPALQSDTTYYWVVKWWNARGESSAFSSVAQFDTAYLNSTLWTGKWLSGQNMMRKEFSIGAVNRARAYVCGLGYFELYINGKRIGDSRLDPGWTSYDQRSFYVAHDITSHLKANSKNVIGVMLGNGWWGQPDGLGRAPILLAQISVDGKTVVETDSSWNAKNGPITFNTIYDGETYDARLDLPGWAETNYNTSGWTSPSIVNGVNINNVRLQMIYPIKIVARLTPKNLTQPQPGVYVFDFGQNFAGWCTIKVKGPAGTTVVLKHAEILQHSGNGMIYTENLRTAKATDTFILKGDPNGETYTPRFTYHGFRFVQLTGYPGVPTLDILSAEHLSSGVTSGNITFDDAILNRIQRNIWWGQTSNLMSVPTDCDQRDERLGWMADGHLSSGQAFHNFDVPAFYKSWVDSMQDDEVNGGIADTVPYIRYGSRPGDPAWSAAFPIMISEVNRFYGDVSVVKAHYDGMKQYTDLLIGRAQSEGLGNMFSFYGDWVPPPPAPRTSVHLTASWYFLLGLKEFVAMATILGNQVDVKKYTVIYEQFVPEFNKAFLNSGTHVYDIGVQTSYLLPLHLDIVPQDQAANVSVHLLNRIVSQCDTHLDTGILGTKYLMPILDKLGMTSLGVELATQTTYPSWGYMIFQTIEASATTLWELWDSPNEGPGMNSRNHIMFGSVGEWFYSKLAGIQQARGSTGYSKIEISPPSSDVILMSTLTSVDAHVTVGSGIVESGWKRTGGERCASIPENHNLTLSCGGSAGGVIREITFASFGTPQGSCKNYDAGSCHSDKSKSVVESACLGKESCTVTASDEIFSDPCFGTYKTLTVQYVCSAESEYSLSVQIPVGTVANIKVSKLAMSDVKITESQGVVWQNNKFVPGISGISHATEHVDDVIFSVGSGSYRFAVSGRTGSKTCATAPENANLNIKCPSGQLVRMVNFASFGTPSGTCGNFKYGSCNAGSSKYMVQEMCIGKNACVIEASDWNFGDPCVDTVKNAAVEVTCA
eukprot:TRINITY_DN7294_c0_g2_i1.p1 TRINITY_DN7294_c0_g2~~TRINITY_DN7294_c0_g2_i1.p1  ORF type:complete len:1083 (+),score=341.06 TRINITY_DN7294_c0_g2_i1:2597-5845(+)